MLLRQGIKTAKPLADVTMANAGILGAVYFLPFLAVWLLYLTGYAFMACGVFLTQVEFRVVMPVSLLALAFMFWAPTRSMATGVLSYVLNVGFKFFMQAVLASLVFILTPIMAPPITVASAFDVALLQAVGMLITAGLMTYLFSRYPPLSRSISPDPLRSVLADLQTAAGLFGMATGSGMLMRAGGAAVQRMPPTPNSAGPSAPGGSPQSGTAPRPLPRPPPTPPRIPAAQAVNTILRSGAQYLGQGPQGGGIHFHP